jgi:hypothetical protein
MGNSCSDATTTSAATAASWDERLATPVAVAAANITGVMSAPTAPNTAMRDSIAPRRSP